MVEYRVIKLPGGIIGWPSEKLVEEDLNALAADGWEIATTLLSHGSTVAIVVERDTEDSPSVSD